MNKVSFFLTTKIYICANESFFFLPNRNISTNKIIMCFVSSNKMPRRTLTNLKSKVKYYSSIHPVSWPFIHMFDNHEMYDDGILVQISRISLTAVTNFMWKVSTSTCNIGTRECPGTIFENYHHFLHLAIYVTYDRMIELSTISIYHEFLSL